ncbi:MAG: hypothetical protein OQK00_01880 [Rhodobacteraceae bacterium]|nr:hypothetical protein [Paracoccaceae bacterium]
MTKMQVKSGEHGLIRLFAIDPADEPPLMSTEPDWDADHTDPPWPLRDALGAEYLDSDFIEVFDVADLTGVGLPGYMIQGLGIPEQDIAPDRGRLDALTGHVLIVLSSAFGGFEQTLTPRAPLRWIGTWREEKAPIHFEPLPNPEPAPHLVPRGEKAEMTPHTRVLFAILALPILLLGLGGTLYALFLYLN